MLHLNGTNAQCHISTNDSSSITLSCSGLSCYSGNCCPPCYRMFRSVISFILATNASEVEQRILQLNMIGEKHWKYELVSGNCYSLIGADSSFSCNCPSAFRDQNDEQTRTVKRTSFIGCTAGTARKLIYADTLTAYRSMLIDQIHVNGNEKCFAMPSLLQLLSNTNSKNIQ